jgi:hypothetical protein
MKVVRRTGKTGKPLDLKKTLLNENMVTAGAAKRMRTTLIVEGISKPETRYIQPHEFALLEIDSRYQRGRTNEVNDLIHVLKNGGQVYDPVTLCRRPGDETLYIVDGHQRFWAHHDCGLPLPAIVYESEGWQAEALLFQAMNMRRALTSDTIVKSHQGPGAELLREAAADENHLLFNHVHFGPPGRRQYPAAPMMRAMLAVSRDVLPTGAITVVCGRLDHAIQNDPLAAIRCRAYLRLVPRVFAPGHPMPMGVALIALAKVAEKRWRGQRTTNPINLLPTVAVCGRIGNINWASFIVTHAMSHIHNVLAEIEKRWPVEASRWMAS